MIDNFGRIHNYLRVSLTDRCNHRCFYCMPEEGVQLAEKESLMSIEEIIEISKIFVNLGVNKIRLTGGEPLIRKNVELLIQELGKLPVELAMTTNGVLVHKFIDVFKEAGLKNINVSLDTLKKDKNLEITKRDFFDQIYNNIQLLLDNDFKVKINIVPIKNVNDDEIIDFINLGKNKNLNIRFIEFMPFSGNNWDWNKGIALSELISIITSSFGEKNIIKLEDSKNDTSLNYKVENFKGSFGIISSVTNPFCTTCNRIRLTANGTLKNCLFSNSETDLLTPFRKNEDIIPIIKQSILNKKEQRGGMDTFDKFSDPKNSSLNRSMVAIGG